jgi:anhydro-N-acetylmuramic acid kinase
MCDLWELRRRLEAGEATVAGVLSGTSADGIDVVLARPRRGAPPESLAFRTWPFPAPLGARVRAILDGDALDARGLALLDRDLGRAFGAAARALADEVGLALDLVGSHGQTVWHHDGREPSGAATLQLGDGAEVAAAAGAPAVTDFRKADIARGGEGAPITALVEAELFPEAPRPLVVLNLGGIANATVLARAGELTAFDVGPANALLDGLARRLLGRPFDEGGRAAAAGRPARALVEALLEHPFFALPPPKSTGRDTFGAGYVEVVLARAAGLAKSDVLASAVELIATSVAKALERLPGARGAERVLACGGGVHHRALLAALAERTGLAVLPTSAEGIDPDAREALAFALLAARAVLGRPSTHPGATGARPGGILGKLSLAPERELGEGIRIHGAGG